MTPSSNCEIAWAAGLWEGEGWISVCDRRIYKGKSLCYVNMGVDMTDRDVLERLPEIFNYGLVKSSHKTLKEPWHKEQFTWRVYKYNKILEITDLMRPWLGKRRLLQIEEVLSQDTRQFSTRRMS